MKGKFNVVKMLLLALLVTALIVGYVVIVFYGIARADDYKAIIRDCMCNAMLKAQNERKWDLWHLTNEQAYVLDGEAVSAFAKRTKTDRATGLRELNKMIDDPLLKPCKRLWGNGPYPDDSKKNTSEQRYDWLPGEYYGGVGESFVANPNHPTCTINVMRCRKGASKGDIVCEPLREEKCVCGVCLSPGYESKYPPIPTSTKATKPGRDI